jgi:hypothetical protein
MNDAAHILFQRLHDNGMRHISRVRATLNRSVLVSLSKKGILSVHEVFAAAPDGVIRAIVRFVAPGSTRAIRKSAQRDILEYYRTAAPRTAVASIGLRRADRAQPGDAELVEKLGLLFDEYNQRHFRASLPTVPIRLSGRMKTRLGHLTLTERGEPSEITISRRHLHAHGWNEVAHTLLHEMVHLWQAANGHAVDHGPGFRAKARETGVTASARRWVRPERGRRFADHVDEFDDLN